MSNQKQEKKNPQRPQQKTVPLIQPMSVAAAQKATASVPARAPASSKTTPAPTLTNATKDAPKSDSESSFSFRPLILGLIAGLAIAAGVTAYRARARLAGSPPVKPDTVATASSEPEHETAIAFGVSRGAASAAPAASAASPPPAPTFAEAVPPPTSQARAPEGPPVASATASTPAAVVTTRPRPLSGNAQASRPPIEKPEEPKKPPPQQPPSVDSLLQQQLKSTIP